MKNIGNFLDKFKNKAVKEIYIRDNIVKIIKKITNIDINIENIDINSGVLKVKLASSIEKNEIFIKKDRILKEIKEKIGGIRISDIS